MRTLIIIIITRKVKWKSRPPEWIDAEYKQKRAERRKLEKRWKRTKEEGDHKLYVEKRNECTKMSIEKQEKYLQQFD